MRTDSPLSLGSTVGILGGGQLGRMLCEAASRLGLKTHIYCPECDAPAFQVSTIHTIADYQDLRSLEAFAQSVDVVTFEFENIPSQSLKHIEQIKKTSPSTLALEKTQDRLTEKEFISDLGIRVAPFAKVSNTAQLAEAIKDIGYPAYLKTRRFGYDGKGQIVVRPGDDPEKAYLDIGGGDCIAEGLIKFDMEISVISVRSRTGEIRFYDPARNIHSNQILSESHVPSGLSQELIESCKLIAKKIGDALDFTGVFAVELFHQSDGSDHPIVVNEIAPRVHNSGHWTQDACLVDQFENHIRAIAEWPLGSTERHSNAVMTNLIGDDLSDWHQYAAEPHCAVHIYGKAETRPGRKMGHVTSLVPMKS